MLHFIYAADIGIGDLTECFNKAFSEYPIPLQMTTVSMHQKMQREMIDTRLSVVAMEDNVPVGFILHACGDKDGTSTLWNGGTGVVASHRGQRMVARMYDFILPRIKERRIERIILEVLEENTAARKAYEHIGFSVKRKLDSYRGIPWVKAVLFQTTISDWQSTQHLNTFFDYPPSWQFTNAVLQNWGEAIQHFVVKERENIIGLLRWNQETKRVCQFGVSPYRRRRGVAAALFKRPGEFLTVLNIDKEDTATASLFHSLGLEKYITQHEMEWLLSPGSNY